MTETIDQRVNLIYIKSYISFEQNNDLLDSKSNVLNYLDDLDNINPIRTQHCTIFQVPGGLHNYRRGITVAGNTYDYYIKNKKKSDFSRI